MKIQWTKHAEVRQKEWERKLGITREEVEGILSNPEQIVKGDMDLLIAQTKRRNGIYQGSFRAGRRKKKGDHSVLDKQSRKILEGVIQ